MKTEAPRRLRHIVDTMSYSPLPEVAGSSTPKPLPAVPVNVTPAPLPIPTSSFSTYVPFRSKCGHITMSRVYHPGLRCQRCLKYGAFGWLYGCTEQREWILDDMHRRGSKVSFDETGERYSEQMSLGKWGPDNRQDKYSVLKEMTQEQMQSYTPQQIATLLAQRENVWKTAELDMMSPQYQPHGRAPLWSSLGSNTLQSSTSLFETQPGESSNERPWVPPPHHHCQFKVCHRCYRGAAEKSWLSLDGIVNGDISPTAATGYAFSYMKERPICDVSVVNSLGYRAVPLPRPLHLPTHPLPFFQTDNATQIVLYDPDEDGSDWTTDTDSSDSSASSHYNDSLGNANPPASTWLFRTSNGNFFDAQQAETEHVEYSSIAPVSPYKVKPEADLPEAFYEAGLFPSLDEVAEVAFRTELPGTTYAEELFFTEGMMEDLGVIVIEQDEESHRSGGEPVHVRGGVAVTEEAMDMSLAGLVTQV